MSTIRIDSKVSGLLIEELQKSKDLRAISQNTGINLLDLLLVIREGRTVSVQGARPTGPQARLMAVYTAWKTPLSQQSEPETGS